MIVFRWYFPLWAVRVANLSLVILMMLPAQPLPAPEAPTETEVSASAPTRTINDAIRKIDVMEERQRRTAEDIHRIEKLVENTADNQWRALLALVSLLLPAVAYMLWENIRRKR
jgi:hypothetical protein